MLDDFLGFAGELPLLGHRILFDYSFLKRAAVNAGKTFERSGVDTLKLSRQYLAELPSRRLSELCAYFNIPIEAHRALEDARAAHFLYQELCARFYEGKSFSPIPLLYKVKKEGPASPRQKERLRRLLEERGIVPDYDVELLTKNEASRLTDKLWRNRYDRQKRLIPQLAKVTRVLYNGRNRAETREEAKYDEFS